MQQKQILKNATGVDISELAKRVDLASIKSEVHELGIGKLEITPVILKNKWCSRKRSCQKRYIWRIC